ncbi:MAG: Y-family DNA polymerase [Cypionkella sp.]
MFGGMRRRIVSLWFPRLPSDRVLRARPLEAPFAVTLRQSNTERLYCVTLKARRLGLRAGMSFTDAHALCPDLVTKAADLAADARFLEALRRWALRYCPWVGLEGGDGLVLDITGSAHLWGGEAGLLADMRGRLARAGVAVQIGLGDTRGAAWGLARHGEGVAEAGAGLAALGGLPVEALRLEPATVVALQRLGLRRVADLAGAARAPLARRFGPELMLRLDQALGAQGEQISPTIEPPHYGVRLTLPEPIGLAADVMAGVARLLDQLCAKLKAQEAGARVLRLSLRRVDQASQQVDLRLAGPMRDPARILPLFARGVDGVDSGFGIDQLRLEAVVVEPLAAEQVSIASHLRGDRKGGQSAGLEDLITRIGTRIGLENVLRFLPADSHIPERGFLIAPAAYSVAEGGWVALRPRPLSLFAPEPVQAEGPRPPRSFRWPRMAMTTARATGPERIAPEWWLEDDNWRHGVRDYWRIETRQGRRLWMFYTPQNPGWCVQGEFA